MACVVDAQAFLLHIKEDLISSTSLILRNKNCTLLMWFAHAAKQTMMNVSAGTTSDMYSKKN